MTFPISPETFWEVFAEKFGAEWNDPDKQLASSYNNAPEWKTYITGFLNGLSSFFSCVSDIEYWPKLDVAYFDKVGGQWGEWALEVAIEHENNVNWHEELSKLLMINAGLKVLIAYEDCHDQLLKMLSRFVVIYKSRKYLCANSGWLVIIGPRHIPAKRDFVAYKFDGNAIEEITGGKKIIS